MPRPSGCTGECCIEFPIGGSSHLEVINMLERNKAFEEHRRIAQLLVLESDGPSGARYSCRFFDTVTRLCKEYEKRPPYMCGQYPYDGPCRHCWLTLQQLSSLELTAANSAG